MIGLVSPIGDHSNEVFGAQDHHRVLRQRLVDRFGIVLRHDGQQHTVVSQVADVVLEVAVALPDAVLAERDAADAVIPDDTTPQRVVEIEHEHLPGAVQHSRQQMLELPSEKLEAEFREPDAPEVPIGVADQRAPARVLEEELEVQHRHVRLLGRERHDAHIHVDRAATRPPESSGVGVGRCGAWSDEERSDDDLCRRMGPSELLDQHERRLQTFGRAERRYEGVTVGVHEDHIGRRVGRRRRWVGEPELEVSDPTEYEVMSGEARCQ